MPSSSADCGSSVGSRRMALDRRARQGRRGRQVLRLFQRHRAGEERAVAPRPRAAARAQGRHPPARRRAAGRRRRRRPDRARAPDCRAGPASNRKAGRRTPGSPRRCAGRGRSRCSRTSRSTSSSGCASRPRRKRSACSAATCTTCCWPRRPDSARRWGSIPGIRTGVKVAVVDGTGKVLDTATVYPHEPRKDWDGTLRTLGRALRAARRAARSRSATAPRRARPTRSPAI